MRWAILALALMTLDVRTCPAQGKGKLARETAEYVLAKFGRGTTRESVEGITKKIESLALKHGDETFMAVKKVGPGAIRMIEEAGEHGAKSVKLLGKYGDEAVWVVGKPGRLKLASHLGDDAAESMMKHGEIVEPLLTKGGKPASTAFKSLGGQNARRLAMMHEADDLARIGRGDELLGVVGKFGDKAMDFIWRNKGKLAVAATLTAFLADPEPFINGAVQLGEAVVEHVAEPLAEATGESLVKSAGIWVPVAVVTVAILAAGCWLRFRRRKCG